jgi:hypothetical protein
MIFKADGIGPLYMLEPNPTEPAPILAFLGFLQKYLIKADGFHSNQEASIDWFIHLIFFALVEEKENQSQYSVRYLLNGIWCRLQPE